MLKGLWEYLKYGVGRPPGTMWSVEKSYFEHRFRFPRRMEMAYLFYALRARYPEKPEDQVWAMVRRCTDLDDAIVEAVRVDFGAEVGEKFSVALTAFPRCSKCRKYRALSTRDTLCYGCRKYGHVYFCHDCRLYWTKGQKHCPKCGRELSQFIPPQVEVNTSEEKSVAPDAGAYHGENVSAFDQGEVGVNEQDQASQWTAKRWNDEGVNLEKDGFLGDALDCYSKAVELEPELELAWFNKGCLHQRLGQHDQAIPCFDRVVELNPINVGAWNNKGNSLEQTGRLSEALACVERALGIDPLCAEAWLNQGSINLRRYRLNSALACYCKAAELSPENPGAWFCKGFVEKTMGRCDDAIYSFERFLELAKAEDAQQVASARKHLVDLRNSQS
jgi:Tfp pilus assembly protein PilF